jgi:glycosyltransferase involved in cell wall biosynthesis
MTPAQRRLAVILGILDDVVELPSLSRPVVAAVCRRSQMLLMPSTREGFGLPIVEAMSAGAVVVASNIPVLRETGGHAAIYCEPDRVEEWVDVICTLSGERDRSPDLFEVRRRRGFEHAARFSWDAYASRMIDIYDEIAGRAS